MTKKYIIIGKADLFYKSMGLYGNFTAVMSTMANKKTNWTRKEIS